MDFHKRFWATAFTLTGTIIGAGILGLPYVFSKSGFFLGFFWLVVLGIVMVFVNLCLGEVTLRTKKVMHLPGFAEKYLGKKGKILMLFAVAFGIYSALLAYLIGEGQSFSKLFFGTLDYSIYFAVAFWLGMVFLMREGLRGLKKVEIYGVLIIIVIIFGMLFWFFPDVNLKNIHYYDFSNFFLPFGVILFALLGFTSIPEMRMMIKGNEKLLKKAIILGSVIPVILYFIFSFIFIGVLGKNISEVATVSFGGIITLLGIATMLTSYFVLSFALKDIFVYDLNMKGLVFPFVFIAPLLLYFIVLFFNLADFVKVLGVGGVVSGGLTGILILIMNKKSKIKGNRKPEFSIPVNWPVIVVLSVIFLLGVAAELFYFLS